MQHRIGDTILYGGGTYTLVRYTTSDSVMLVNDSGQELVVDVSELERV